MSITELRGPLLRDVSRSFFISIRLLPRSVRDPIALAYLLARATDTIADTTEVPLAERLHTLPQLSAAISGVESAESIDRLRISFAPLQNNSAERLLVQKLPELLRWLATLSEADRTDIRAVLATITRGQLLDLQRFGETTTVVALASAAELDEYTYLVAGCVGEFWTRVCSRHVPQFSRRDFDDMLALGIAYGKGLQLTNILRDLGNDLRAGRCYLPADELNVSPGELLDAPDLLAPVLERWLARAAAGLHSGIEYSSAVRPARIRIATALPALIGIRTIKLLRKAGAAVLREHVKIPRAEVRSLIVRAFVARASHSWLQKAYHAYSD